ncbi:twin-arginine translocation signal domain-containing protein [Halosimplex pelagicum]|uniref:Ig-like domain-containing protein n=1 Tax=Halosimplex pelagicum TaxID=869886 RepID=A0A7D5PAF4_9EURY|nr:twin-arginine translocation signal domain-containing protein [Halosimplex pelagicum]QLH84737.1 hypothetical protein HZS54_25195 [Halosimplex pelagicum]
MPSLNRRSFLASSTAALVATAGCSAAESSPQLAHWVTVYLGDRDEAHEVSVTVTDEAGETVFEKEYSLSDDNEADEDAPFPDSAEPDTVVVTVGGARFERDWPGFEQPQLPCDGENRSGIEVWIESDESGSPSVRIEADCQYVTME